MKIIPKLLKGGGFTSFFTMWTPVETAKLLVVQESSSKKKEKSDSDDAKKRLTEKDLFSMLKDIDGLDNDMLQITRSLINTILTNNLLGVEIEDLATTYLKSLYLIKVANNNKKKYDAAYEKAQENGALAEPAISLDGNLIALNDDGDIIQVSLDDYQFNPEGIHLLSVAELANLRRYEPRLANTSFAFDIMNNSIGFESFLNLLDLAKVLLGSTEISNTGLFSFNAEAKRGLEKLNNLSDVDKLRVLSSINGDGMYEYTKEDISNAELVLALIDYMTAILPDRAKTWAAFKLNTTDKDAAARTLVTLYLMGRLNLKSSLKVNYLGSDEDVLGSSKSGKSGTEPNKGFWAMAVTGLGGEDSTFLILDKKGSFSIDGKMYGTTPGMDKDLSLGDYISNSKVVLKDPKLITFGNKKLSVNSFNDVMIPANSGAMITMLPVNLDGTVNLSLAKQFSDITDQIKREGILENTQKYITRLAQLLKLKHLNSLIDPSTGLPNPKYFSLFLVLNGYATSRAKVLGDNGLTLLGEQDQSYLYEVKDDSILDRVNTGLSSKDKGDYDLDHNIVDFWFWSNDKVYEGAVFIPLTNNINSAMIADDNDVKMSLALGFEADYLRFLKKANNAGQTNSNVL